MSSVLFGCSPLQKPWSKYDSWPQAAAEAYYLIGMCQTELRKYTAALDAFNSAIRIDSHYAEVSNQFTKSWGSHKKKWEIQGPAAHTCRLQVSVENSAFFQDIAVVGKFRCVLCEHIYWELQRNIRVHRFGMLWNCLEGFTSFQFTCTQQVLLFRCKLLATRFRLRICYNYADSLGNWLNAFQSSFNRL